MNEPIVTVIFGIRGCGKTVKLRRLLIDRRRYLVVNTLNRSGFERDVGVTFHDLESLKRFWLDCYTKSFRLIYSPRHCADRDHVRNDVAELCQLAMSCKNMTLAIEEMNVLFEGRRPPVEFEDVVFSGREPGIELIGLAQIPTGFGAAMRSQTKEAFIFHTHEQSHLDIFKNLVGKEGVEKIKSLNNYEYLRWSMLDGKRETTVQKDDPLPYLS